MTMRGKWFDRTLPDLFVDLANASTPDYLEAAIEEASSRPQRPAWTFPGRWLPVQITTRAVPGARMPWRQLGILAIIGILLAAAAVAYSGARRSVAPAPPFGPAANGAIALERDGDIVSVDQATGAVTPITSGPEMDRAPEYSRDGTRIAFERLEQGVPGRLLMVAAADGSGLVQVTPQPRAGLLQWTLSPDGREVLVAALSGGTTQLNSLAVDGSREPRRIDVQLPPSPDGVEPAAYRPPHGHEILVIGQPAGSTTRGIYVADAATGAMLRTIVEPVPDTDVFGASWSPTGDAISYGRFSLRGDGFRALTHVVSADGSDDRPIDTAPGIAYNGALSEWSNDGSRLVVIRGQSGDDTRASMRVVSVQGDAAPVELMCDANTDGACPNYWEWSPDDTMLLGATTDERGVLHFHLADPATGRITATSWTGGGAATWQRTTP